MFSESLEVEIEFKSENGKVFAWTPTYGITVSGTNRAEAMAKMKKALTHISQQKRKIAQLAWSWL